MHRKILLIIVVSLCYGCQNNKLNNKSTIFVANHFSNCSIKNSNSNAYSDNICSSDSAEQLLNHNLLFSKIKYLKQKKNYKQAEEILKNALKIKNNSKALQKELVFIFILQEKWLDALTLIDNMDVKTNDSMRIKIESHIGKYSAGTNLELLPQIVKNKLNGTTPLRANIDVDYLSYFELTRVDEAADGMASHEPSIKVSNDGQKILVSWMDDSTNLNRWVGNSAYSSDGGDTWQNFSSSPCADTAPGGYLDMITAYDSINNYMYSGGMKSTFDNQSDCFYLNRINLADDSRSNYFIIEDSDPNSIDFDKVFLATNDTGEIWMSTRLPGSVMYSNDFGENFNNYTDAPTGMAQTVFHNNCLYLLSHESNKLWRCDLGMSEPELVTPATYEFYYQDYIPGNSIVHKFSYMAFHPNGDLYIIYPELISVDSDEVAIWMSKSTDNGSTWQEPWIVTPDIPGDRFLQWIEIDQLGVIHISYMDTRNMVQDDNSDIAYFDMYYSYSADGGQNWLETRVTPTSVLVQGASGGGSFVGDYTEMSVGNPNAVFLSFAWQANPNISDLDMYVAKKQMRSDLIYKQGFE